MKKVGKTSKRLFGRFGMGLIWKARWVDVSVLLAASAACAFIAGVMAFKTGLDRLETRRQRARAARTAGSSERGFERLIAQGVPFLFPLARLLGRIGFVSSLAGKLLRAFKVKGFRSSDEAVCSVVIAAFLSAALAGSVLAGNAVFGLMAGCFVPVAADAWATKVLDANEALLRDQLPDALQAMQGCFNVGFSLPQTLAQLSSELDPPLRDVFVEARAVLDVGGSVHDALESIRAASVDGELAFLVTALEVQHRTGSSMQHVLQTTQKAVKDDLALKRSLRTQTAQAKLSAQIVSFMPFALVGVFSLVSPGFLDPFFESLPGMVMLCIAVAMLAVGVASVRRVLRMGRG